MDYSANLMSPTSLLGTIALILILYIIRNKHTAGKSRKEPPGPRPWPVLGNVLQLDLARLQVSFQEMAKKYGSVFTVYLGLEKHVILAGFKTYKEVMVGYPDALTERKEFPSLHDISQNCGVLFSNGETWKEMRKFTLTTLKDFGTGKKLAQDKIIEESHYLIQEFEKHEGKPFDTAHTLQWATANVIAAIAYGSRFEYNDPIFQNMITRSTMIDHLLCARPVQLYNAFPRLLYWVNDRRQMITHTTELLKHINDMITGLKETFTPELCRGLVDRFLVQMCKDEELHNLKTQFHNKNLLYTVENMFGAGTDTSASTLSWSLLLMAKYPHIQDQVHQELSREVGSRQVCVEDRKNLPYINAVLHETQRVANVIPYIVLKTNRDITIQDYFIKKDTQLFFLISSVLCDENEWETPHTFNPSHFLDKDGKFIKRNAFIPFSMGRRACVGEGLAKMELFLLFTTLLQRFRFSPAPGVREEDLSLTPNVGLTLTPLPHKLCATLL